LYLATSCSAIFRNEDPEVTPLVPQISVLSVNQRWHTALEIAQKWQSDAYLIDVLVDVKSPNSDLSREKVNFGFQSLNNKSLALIVSCSESCYSEEVKSTIEIPQCLPLEIDKSILEGKDVLELGLQNGGTNYAFNQNASIQLRLERNYPRCEGSTITWTVTFGNNVTFDRIGFVFDARSGELLETR
jgi:hypothetical protein